jgi:hypothetical protein
MFWPSWRRTMLMTQEGRPDSYILLIAVKGASKNTPECH